MCKLTKRSSYGYWPIRDAKSGRCAVRPALPLEYLDRIALHNDLFGDDWQLTGVAETSGGSLHILTSQPFIAGRASTPEEIAALLTRMGFICEDGEIAAWYRASDNLLCLDAHPRNLVTDEAGRVLPIDLILGYAR